MDIDASKEHVYGIIYDIVRRKKEMNRMPCNALYISDLLPMCSDLEEAEIKSAINKLYQEGRIVYGKTINDLWFAPNERR